MKEEIQIVKVIHHEDAPMESERWIRRLIAQFLVSHIETDPKHIGRLLRAVDPDKSDS